MRAYRVVDVFSPEPYRGNPLAVIHDADGLDDHEMAVIARWTNLSETAFLCSPTDASADYRVRIWTTGGELPFAGHPTLGSAHAWLEHGGRPRSTGTVVQECGAGLVTVRRGARLGFEAPPLTRSGPLDAVDSRRVLDALGLAGDDVLDLAWVDNGPGWVGVLLRDPEAVLALRPVASRCAGLKVGLAAVHEQGHRGDGVALEVRAFYSDGEDFSEDPVTGSLNAGLAQWLVPAGRLPDRYVAAQGQVVGRVGRVHVDVEDGRVWVSGSTRTQVLGTLSG